MENYFNSFLKRNGIIIQLKIYATEFSCSDFLVEYFDNLFEEYLNKVFFKLRYAHL